MKRTAGDTTTTSLGKEDVEHPAAQRRPPPWYRRFRIVARGVEGSTTVFDRVASNQHGAPPTSSGTALTDARVDNSSGVDVDVDVDDAHDAAPGWRRALVFLLVAIVALAAVTARLGVQAYATRQDQRVHAQLLEAGKEAAVKLTTISYADADADVRQILDSAISPFANDFEARSEAFVEMVKKLQSTTVGTVAQAGIESVDGDKAQVLVAVSVKTTLGAGTEQPVKVWRMRIDVQKVGDETKVSNVEFVS